MDSQNQLAKYLDKDIKNIISNVHVVQGTAKDSGNIYYAIEMNFINGYSSRIFLRGAEAFAWVNAIETLMTQKDIDNQF